MARMHMIAGAALALLLAVGPAWSADAGILKSSTNGTPKLTSIDVIRFGPQGLLLIGDGRGGQVLAVDTQDTKEGPALKNALEQIEEKLAGKLGVEAKQVAIIDLAVNPASRKIYLAVRRQNAPVILTIDGDGKITEFSLEKVTFARVELPKGETGPITKITDLAWAGKRILAAGQANEQFACKLLSIPVPIEHDAKGTIYSTETYHVSHGAWETRAPMSSLMPYEENGKMFVVGSFACTPVVKYPLEELQPGAKVKGISVVELGAGNRPIRMLTYDKNGQAYVLMNTFRFHHKQKPYGPSPYWTVRMERGLLAENEKTDKNAIRRIDANHKPITERIKQIDDYNGVVNMDKLDAGTALVLRETDKGLTLAPVALP